MENPFQSIETRLANIECLLLDLKQTNKFDLANSKKERLLTINETAAYLSLSVPTIYRLVQKAEIPYSKKGKRLYFSDTDLTEWVKAGRRKTVDQISQEASSYLSKKGGNQ